MHTASPQGDGTQVILKILSNKSCQKTTELAGVIKTLGGVGTESC